MKETGFADKEIPGAIYRPSCPSDFYVMGHVAVREADGINPRDPFPSTYKCLHESILRKGTFMPQPLYTGSQPGTSVWNPKLIAEEFANPVSLWAPDCRPPYCASVLNSGCVDSISIGLFYGSPSETQPNFQITGRADVAPTNIGPRCLTRFRDCTREQADGVLLTNSGADWNGVSDCDVELAYDSSGLPFRGLLGAWPAGLPTFSSTPIELRLRVEKEVCRVIAPSGQEQNIGMVRINGYRTTWMSHDLNIAPTYCQITVQAILPAGEFAPGPARIDIKTYNGDVIPPVEGDTRFENRVIGSSFGRLYLYKDPSAEAELIEPIVINTDDCDLYVTVKMPPTTQVLGYGGFNFLCMFRTGNETMWRDGSNPKGVYKDWLGYRAIQDLGGQGLRMSGLKDVRSAAKPVQDARAATAQVRRPVKCWRNVHCGNRTRPKCMSIADRA
eukprot:482615-Rhodomonas_salina.2